MHATGGKKLSVSHAETVELLHMWHGNTVSRQCAPSAREGGRTHSRPPRYNTRAHILDKVADLQELVTQNEDGLYEVADGDAAVSRNLGHALCRYFEKRDDDGIM